MVKCFSCSNEAVAIVNCCSPTSSTGLTEPRPRCEECLANIIGANVLRLLVSSKEFDKRMKALVKNEYGYWVKKQANETETKEVCCICGKKAEVSSEGSLYCKRCAMRHAK